VQQHATLRHLRHAALGARAETTPAPRGAAQRSEKTDRDSSPAPTSNHPPASAASLIRIKQR